MNGSALEVWLGSGDCRALADLFWYAALLGLPRRQHAVVCSASGFEVLVQGVNRGFGRAQGVA